MPANLCLLQDDHPIPVKPVGSRYVLRQGLEYLAVVRQVDASGTVLAGLGGDALRHNPADEQRKSSGVAQHATEKTRGAENS